MKKKLKSIPQLKRLADKLWAKVIHEKWAEQCAVCGSTKMVQAHHFRSRRMTSTRWNTDNGTLLCVDCHWKAHKDYEWFRRQFIDIPGIELVEDLWVESYQLIKVTRDYIEGIIIQLRGELA